MLQSASVLNQSFSFTLIQAAQHSLASAIPAPPLGRPYIPQAANVSARLRSRILQDKDINLVSLILPSPECDRKIIIGKSIIAVIETADPWLSRNLSFCEFLVAFGIYRDVICSIYPERWLELNSDLALIELNLKYGRNIFY